MKALVLRREPRFEFDEIITLLTEGNELVRAVARGSKKQVSKNSFHLEPGSYNEMELIQGKEWWYVASVVPDENGVFPRPNVETLVALAYMCALLSNVLKERVRYEGLWYETMRWREILGTTRVRGRSMVSPYIYALLQVLGFRPIIDECSRCGKVIEKSGYWFSLADGGMLCETCRALHTPLRAPLIPLTEETYSNLKQVCNGVVESTATFERDKEVYRVLHQFLQFHLEQEVSICLLFSP